MMDKQTSRFSRVELVSLGIILVLFAILSVVGITWGLPSRKIDTYLFGDDAPWPGEKIYRLANAGEKFSPTRGADVDVDPLEKTGDEPIPLTATEEDVAKIYLRYRLYTYQPDEMITMMALAGMNPRNLKFDPKLYQYGGLFIYPVGGLIGACGQAGLIDVRSDVTYYLDNPDEFGKFYIVARAYSAAWGLIGAIIVFAITRRLAGRGAAILAALLFTLMPVVICMAHEGKPHLPGAVLMLMAVLFAMRHLAPATVTPDQPGLIKGSLRARLLAKEADPPAKTSRANWWLMCICCGGAFGMVLSSWPIFVLIPLIALLEWRGLGDTVERSSAVESSNTAGSFFTALMRTFTGVAIGVLAYLATNPYIVINAITNRDVLKSNFGNSFAMYEVSRIADGLVRVIELTVEGAAWPILAFGVIALVIASARKNRTMLPLVVPALLFFVQFVMIGAGKPAEYGRFGVFTNTALAIGTACLLSPGFRRLREVLNWAPALLVVAWTAFFGGAYLYNFWIDTTDMASRLQARQTSAFRPYLPGTSDTWLESDQRVALIAQPAPYCCPPLPFHRTSVHLFPNHESAESQSSQDTFRWVYVYPVDRTGLTIGPERIAAGDAGGPSYPWKDRRNSAALESVEPGTSLDELYRDVLTSISWANKPFEITAAGWRDAP